MSYDGSGAPAGPGPTPMATMSDQQIQNMRQVAQFLMKNQQQNQKPQSWLQVAAQMANTAAAQKYMNAANAAQLAMAKQGLNRPNMPGTPGPPPPMPGAQPDNPFASIPPPPGSY